MKRARAVCAIVGLLLLSGANAHAYLKLGSIVGGKVVSLKWDSFPIRYFVSNHDVPGVSAQQFRDAVGRAFASWEAVPNTGDVVPVRGLHAGVAARRRQPQRDRVRQPSRSRSRSRLHLVHARRRLRTDRRVRHLPQLDSRGRSRPTVRPAPTTWSRSRCTRLAICTASVTRRSERLS